LKATQLLQKAFNNIITCYKKKSFFDKIKNVTYVNSPELFLRRGSNAISVVNIVKVSIVKDYEIMCVCIVAAVYTEVGSRKSPEGDEATTRSSTRWQGNVLH